MITPIAIGLAGGQGVRCRPLTLKTADYIRAKAAVRFLGRRVIDWLLHLLSAQGIADVFMVCKGQENYFQVKSLVGYGESHGMHLRYSPVHLRYDNTGSADALLANLVHFAIISPHAFVFPTDSVLDFDLASMVEAHHRTGAVVTIAATRQPAEVIAGQYGLIDHDAQNCVSGFMEKPSLKAIYAHLGAIYHTDRTPPSLVTNAGFYLISSSPARRPGACSPGRPSRR